MYFCVIYSLHHNVGCQHFEIMMWINYTLNHTGKICYLTVQLDWWILLKSAIRTKYMRHKFYILYVYKYILYVYTRICRVSYLIVKIYMEDNKLNIFDVFLLSHSIFCINWNCLNKQFHFFWINFTQKHDNNRTVRFTTRMVFIYMMKFRGVYIACVLQTTYFSSVGTTIDAVIICILVTKQY